MKNIKKKLKENWLGILCGIAIGYFGNPYLGALMITDSLKEDPVAIYDESLTDSAPSAIIKDRKEVITEEDNDEK